MNRRDRPKLLASLWNNPVLVGALTLLVVTVAVYVSYGSENGIPFIPTYNVTVTVSDADGLAKNDVVRIGGARVGQILTVTPEPADGHPDALVGLQLQKDLEPLGTATRFEIRLTSILGGKYLELFPSRAGAAVPDGGVLPETGEVSVVDFNTAFNVFSPTVQGALRSTIASLANAMAGRGPDVNLSISQLAASVPSLTRVLRALIAPGTDLPQLISGAAGVTGTLAPLTTTVDGLLAHADTTLDAINVADPALAGTLDQLPGTESQATALLSNARPVLAAAKTLVDELHPSAPLIRPATADLNTVLADAIPALAHGPELGRRLTVALTAARHLAADPATRATFVLSGRDDLATQATSAFLGLGALLHAVAPAQLSCNFPVLWLRNFESTLSEGDASGTWIRVIPILDPSLQQDLLASKPSANLHVDPYPVEQAGECQAGNETYSTGQSIGDPGFVKGVVEPTSAPASALALGRAAGLVP